MTSTARRRRSGPGRLAERRPGAVANLRRPPNPLRSVASAVASPAAPAQPPAEQKERRARPRPASSRPGTDPPRPHLEPVGGGHRHLQGAAGQRPRRLRHGQRHPRRTCCRSETQRAREHSTPPSPARRSPRPRSPRSRTRWPGSSPRLSWPGNAFGRGSGLEVGLGIGQSEPNQIVPGSVAEAKAPPSTGLVTSRSDRQVFRRGQRRPPAGAGAEPRPTPPAPPAPTCPTASATPPTSVSRPQLDPGVLSAADGARTGPSRSPGPTPSWSRRRRAVARSGSSAWPVRPARPSPRSPCSQAIAATKSRSSSPASGSCGPSPTARSARSTTGRATSRPTTPLLRILKPGEWRQEILSTQDLLGPNGLDHRRLAACSKSHRRPAPHDRRRRQQQADRDRHLRRCRRRRRAGPGCSTSAGPHGGRPPRSATWKTPRRFRQAGSSAASGCRRTPTSTRWARGDGFTWTIKVTNPNDCVLTNAEDRRHDHRRHRDHLDGRLGGARGQPDVQQRADMERRRPAESRAEQGSQDQREGVGPHRRRDVP